METNRLAGEQSPYLLQHQHNPVDWYPWGDEAFERAAAEDKPVFLSIGYSTCHWCHVMAHESFEDESVAHLLNDHFVSIKVDREERPDIDSIYMAVCQAMTGHGGWPLTVVLTPDRKPFFVGTYIPRTSRYGRQGMLDLLPRLAGVWQEHREEVLDSAEYITTSLQAPPPEGTRQEVNPEVFRMAFDQFVHRFDCTHGGFGTAPKFPSPHNLLYLLRYWKRSGEPFALEMVETTLQRMREGGIFDHVGFGFHRYSTDARWRLPHFEKMLYDQALLLMVYVETYQATKKTFYARTAREIATYVLRDLTSPEGGFYSAEDADSEGKEGKFYLWTLSELKQMLGLERTRLFAGQFNVREEGNFEEEATGIRTGENILYLDPASTDSDVDDDPISERDLFETDRARLFEEREKRVHPGKDDKILTDWNGLMIAALAMAGRVLDEPDYTSAARRAALFVQDTLQLEGHRLLHRYRNGQAGLTANLDDYAFLTWGFIDLYQTTFESRWLRAALVYTQHLEEYFWDKREGGFYFTPEYGERLIVRQKEWYDGAIPSGNSVTLNNLVRLARLTADSRLEEIAGELVASAGRAISTVPSAFTGMLSGFDLLVGPTSEIVLAGKEQETVMSEMIALIHSTYLPATVVLFRAEENGDDLLATIPFLADYHAIDGKSTAYVCRNYECNLPTTEIEALRNQLQEL